MKVLEPQQLSSDELTPLRTEELEKINAYWRACNYLCAGMIYLRENPLLREALRPEHIKQRLLGHWGSDPGQTFIWVHLNRLIKKLDLNVIYISGPGRRRRFRTRIWKARIRRFIRTRVRMKRACGNSSGSFRSLAGLAATVRRKLRVRSTKVVNWATVCRMVSERPSIIPT